MQIALSESQEEFVKQAVSEGRYASVSEVVSHAIELIQAREKKLNELQARIAASIRTGGSHSQEEMEAAMGAQCQQLHTQGIPW